MQKMYPNLCPLNMPLYMELHPVPYYGGCIVGPWFWNPRFLEPVLEVGVSQHVKRCLGIILLVPLLAGCFGMTDVPAESSTQFMAQEADEAEKLRTVQVSGVGEGQVEPDTAVVILGIETQAETAQAALEENNAGMQALMDTLVEAGVTSENLQTRTIRLTPRYEFNEINNSTTLTGYTAFNSLEVRTDVLQGLGVLLDQSVNAGANTIEGIRFEVSDPGNAIDQVRETAVENARHKAEQLADLTGTTLGPILEIRESSSSPAPLVRQMESQAESVASVSISPGTQTISVHVEVTWVLIVNPEQ